MWRTLVLWQLLTILLTGCLDHQDGAIRPPQASDSEKGLTSASFPLIQLDGEPNGYGLYTYVIFGSKISENTNFDVDQASKRLNALLEAIDLSAITYEALDKANIPHSQINLFCIPVKKSNKLADLDNFNSELSLLYREIATGALKEDEAFLNKFAITAGPFLVSTQQPLNKVRTPQAVLFADLTSTNISAMKEVVTAYKQKVNDAVSEKGTNKFDPIKLRILSLILDADKNIKLMKDAVADWKTAK